MLHNSSRSLWKRLTTEMKKRKKKKKRKKTFSNSFRKFGVLSVLGNVS